MRVDGMTGGVVLGFVAAALIGSAIATQQQTYIKHLVERQKEQQGLLDECAGVLKTGIKEIDEMKALIDELDRPRTVDERISRDLNRAVDTLIFGPREPVGPELREFFRQQKEPGWKHLENFLDNQERNRLR